MHNRAQYFVLLIDPLTAVVVKPSPLPVATRLYIACFYSRDPGWPLRRRGHGRIGRDRRRRRRHVHRGQLGYHIGRERRQLGHHGHGKGHRVRDNDAPPLPNTMHATKFRHVDGCLCGPRPAKSNHGCMLHKVLARIVVELGGGLGFGQPSLQELLYLLQIHILRETAQPQTAFRDNCAGMYVYVPGRPRPRRPLQHRRPGRPPPHPAAAYRPES